MNQKVRLHPVTVKYVKKGHPLITKDSYTAKFPQDEFLLVGIDEEGKKACLFLHDPRHPTVKGRVWSAKPPFRLNFKEFRDELKKRIFLAIEKRANIIEDKERENLYLTFGEASNLPGLFIQKLGQTILIQDYTNFWFSYKSNIISAIEKSFPKEELSFWYQRRQTKKQMPPAHIKGNKVTDFSLTEFGYKINVHLGDTYDIGLYTDMASIRKRLIPHLFEGMSVLNLYSYTGAFSLQALHHKASSVVSVDLSANYLKWLEENLSINSHFQQENHQTLKLSVEEAMKKLKDEDKKFDLIISDPPSFSHTKGGKGTNALKNYETLLPKMKKLLNNEGKILIFLNNHQIKMTAFKKIIDPKQYTILQEFSLKDDCLPQKGFPEGNYLKGLLLKI